MVHTEQFISSTAGNDLWAAERYESHRQTLPDPNKHELVLPQLSSLYDADGNPNPTASQTLENALNNGHMAVVQYGASYGLTFNVEHRLIASRARREKEPVVVGVFATKAEAKKLLDPTQVDQRVWEQLDDILNVVEANAFLRIPINIDEENAIPESIRHYIVQNHTIQLWIFADDDPMVPIHTGRNPDGSRKWIGVRSVNVEGESEALAGEHVAEFARQRGATIVSFLQDKFMNQRVEERPRYGSFPIVDVVAGDHNGNAITITRKGNLHRDELVELFTNFLRVPAIYEEKKVSTSERSDFASQTDGAMMRAITLRYASYGFWPTWLLKELEHAKQR